MREKLVTIVVMLFLGYIVYGASVRLVGSVIKPMIAAIPQPGH